jgi:hypothetical protein
MKSFKQINKLLLTAQIVAIVFVSYLLLKAMKILWVLMKGGNGF